MMRPVLLLLVAVFAASAIYRFQIEARTRAAEKELAELERAETELEAAVERARLHVEVLESASRLTELNDQHLALGTVRSGQLLGDRDFAEVIGVPAPAPERPLDPNADIIGNAIGMSEPSLLRKGASE